MASVVVFEIMVCLKTNAYLSLQFEEHFKYNILCQTFFIVKTT